MERPGHRVSFSGARDAETGEDAGMSPASPAGVPGSPQQPAYNPKSKRRHGLVRRTTTAVREVGAAKIISGAISVFLLLSVFSVSFQSLSAVWAVASKQDTPSRCGTWHHSVHAADLLHARICIMSAHSKVL